MKKKLKGKYITTKNKERDFSKNLIIITIEQAVLKLSVLPFFVLFLVNHDFVDSVHICLTTK